MKVLLVSMYLLESCQWKWRRGEVSRLAVHCCPDWLCQARLWGPDPGGLCSPRCPFSLPPALPWPSLARKHAWHRHLPSQSLQSFHPPITSLHSHGHIDVSQWATPVSEVWLFMPIITPTLFGLCRAANPNTPEAQAARNMDFIAGNDPSREWLFSAQMSQQMRLASLHHWKMVLWNKATLR